MDLLEAKVLYKFCISMRPLLLFYCYLLFIVVRVTSFYSFCLRVLQIIFFYYREVGNVGTQTLEKCVGQTWIKFWWNPSIRAEFWLAEDNSSSSEDARTEHADWILGQSGCEEHFTQSDGGEFVFLRFFFLH